MRLPIPGVLVLYAALLCVASPVARADEIDRTDLGRYKSRYVKLASPHFSTVTTIWSADAADGALLARPRYNLGCSNRSDRAFWLLVRFAAPTENAGVTGIAYLEPKAATEFEFTQDSILADVDYGIDISVFADSALTDTLERQPMRVRFDPEVVRALDKRLALRRREEAERRENVERREQQRAAMALPMTFEHVIMKKNMGFLTYLGGRTGHSGTLVVAHDGLTFTTKRGTFSVSASQIRHVSMKATDRSVPYPWVVVDYDVEGKSQTLWLVSAPFPIQTDQTFLPRMRDAIRILIVQQGQARE